MNRSKRLMIVAGGTGGHIFPGITVAHYLINQGWQVRWLGTFNRIEANLVPKYNIKIDFIRMSNMRNKGLGALLLSPIDILNAWYQARIIMKQFRPNVVLGMGGYISGPGGLAAWSLGIPIVIHEQNRIAGLTNKYLAKIATKVIQGFPGAFPRAAIVGNPIRIDIQKLPIPQQRLINRKGPIRILVIGGSQGAHILNKIMPEVAAKLTNTIIIWHQSGKGAQHMVKRLYVSAGQSQHRVTEFIDNMAIAYSWADIIVCRSGALTVSEITTIGLPAIFVPFQHKDRQQYWNALPLEKVGAAKIIEQSKFTADIVTSTLIRWKDRQTLLEMAERARRNGILNATERVANELKLLVQG